jgi:uncharacterized phage protein (TIGR02220 family)
MNKKELWAKAAELVGEQELSRRFCNWCSSLIKKELVKRSESSADEFFLNQTTAILEDLNKRSGRKFRLTPEASKMIRNILSRGYQPEDFYRVHEVKCSQWLNDEKMEHCLRPSTLYRPIHFSEYLAEWEAMEAKRIEIGAKRTAAINAKKGRQVNAKNATSEKTQEHQLIAKLLAKPWHAHETWADFIRWTAQLPTAEAVERYPMPDQIRKMRQATRMLMRVLSGEAMPAVEEEYQRLKKKHADYADYADYADKGE